MGTEDDLCIAVFTCSLLSCLPLDIHLKIVSFLPLRDACALGRCSRYWRELCRSNSVWSSLFRKRWPSLFTLPIPEIEEIDVPYWPPKPRHPTSVEDWKHFYRRRYLHMFAVARMCMSPRELASYHFGFIDVVQFSFDRSANLVINMRGLLYSIKYLKVPRKVVAKALRRRNIHKKKVFPSNKWVYRALVGRENRGSYLTLEEIALGKQGKGKMGAQI